MASKVDILDRLFEDGQLSTERVESFAHGDKIVRDAIIDKPNVYLEGRINIQAMAGLGSIKK